MSWYTNDTIILNSIPSQHSGLMEVNPHCVWIDCPEAVFWSRLAPTMVRASLMVQTEKNLPAMWETWVWSLGSEDPLKKGMESHSNILAWRISMDRRTWWTTVHGVSKGQTWLSDKVHTHGRFYRCLILGHRLREICVGNSCP